MATSQSVFTTETNRLLNLAPSPPNDESTSRIHQFLVVFPTCAALLSLLIYSIQEFRWIRQATRSGAIRLSEDGEASSNSTGTIRLENEEDRGEEKIQDVWDIRDEEMEIDGYPLEEDAFWRKVCYSHRVLP